ncbi:hypothetical protein FRC10_007725 [Ceratobasidium sp. 414]|nr:hypothetical protein FRC10_007725 [Ceratobasidium sp. 414]
MAPFKHMLHLPSSTISRRTIIRFLPTALLLIISLISLSLLEFSSLQQPPLRSSSPKKHYPQFRAGSKHSKLNMASAATALKFITIPPRAHHTATIIFSHGLGDSGEGWRPVAQMLASQHPHVKSVKTFDLYSLGKTDDKEDEEGLLRSAAAINQLVKTENDAGIPNEKIVIGGFSQGAALSLVTGLTSEKKYAGIAILSGWLPIRNKLIPMLPPGATTTPIFWGHGTSDPVVPYRFGAGSAQILKEKVGFQDVEFNSYQGVGHSTDTQEIVDLSTWLKRVIPA